MAGSARPGEPLEPGFPSRLVTDSLGAAFPRFGGLLAEGRVGLVLSRTFPEKLEKEFPLPGAEVWWLTDSVKAEGRTLDPKRLDFEVMRTLKNFAQAHPGGAILLHGVEFLVVQNSLEKVLTFLKQVSDACAPGGMTLLVPVAPDALGTEGLSRLEREFERVERVAGATRPLAAAGVEMLGDAPRVTRFVGRRAELEMLTQDGEGPRLIVVRAMAGMGKSSLAAKVCEVLRGRKNLFWHRIRSWDASPSVVTSLGSFLAAVGRPGLQAVMARGEGHRAAEVLGKDLPGTNCLLVFDDAHEAGADLLAFLRLLKDALLDAADVRVLVLTRNILSFYDRRDVVLGKTVHEIDLPALDSEEVATLLSAEEPVLIDLARQLGGHPLFLELVRSTRAPRIVSEALRDVDRFIEEEIYTHLSDPEKRMMRLAALYRVPVPRQGLFPDASLSHDLLLALVRRSLIQPLSNGRFGLHDTIRDFFARVITDPERREFS